MLSEADGVCKAHANYDARLVKYHPQLVACLTPLPEISVNVSKFAEYFTSEFSDYTTTNFAVITWFDRMIDPNRTYAQSVRDFK